MYADSYKMYADSYEMYADSYEKALSHIKFSKFVNFIQRFSDLL